MSLSSASYHWLARRGFLTHRGRRNRLSLVCAWLFLNLAPFLLAALGAAFLAVAMEIFSPDLYDVFAKITGFTIGCVVCCTYVMMVFLWIQRIHDLGKSGWFALLLLVPVVNIVFLLYLLFAEGEHGPNAYGPDPLTTPYVADTVFSWNQTNPYREA